MSTGMGIVGDLASNGFKFNPRSRAKTGVSVVKSLVDTKSLFEAILGGSAAVEGWHTR